jgi:hypothetical protein
MAEVRYADLHKVLGGFTVTSIGTVDGPPSGDGWQQVAKMPQAKLPAGAGQYAVIVSGKVSQIATGPPAPASHVTTGLLQVCLGTTFGTLHPDFCIGIPAAETLQPTQSFGFQFLLVISTALPDALFGSSWNNDSGSEFAVFARMFANGTTLDWGGSFVVEDVSFLWWDMARIPAGEQFVEDWVSPTPFGGQFDPTQQEFLRTANVIGGVDQVWAVWHQSHYLTPGPNIAAPLIQAGPAPSGSGIETVTAAGGSPLYGMHRGTQVYGTRFGEQQHGGMFVHQVTNGTTRFALYAGVPTGIVVGGSVPRRFRMFGVRVDRLTDLLWRTQKLDQEQGVSLLGNWQATYQAVERPAPDPPHVTEPILVACGECRSGQSGTSGYLPAIYDTAAGIWYVEGAALIADTSRREGVSQTVYARDVFTASTPALQLRTAFVGDITTPTTVGRVQGFSFLCFHPVRDPEDQPTSIGTPPPPLIVNPGTQAPSPAALNVPPVPWNTDYTQRGDREKASLQGITRYRRTWPLFTKPERVFGLQWGPLGEVDAYVLRDWLQANPAWRFTPNDGAPIAVLNLERPELVPHSHRTYTVGMTVAELVYTA